MKILLVILLIIVFAAAVAILFDVVPLVLDMFWRIKIGTLKDERWFDAACDIALKWSKNGLPTVPKTADKRLTVIDRVKGNYKSDTIQSWQTGSLLLSLNEIAADESEKVAHRYINIETGEWLNFINRVDSAFLAYGILSNPKIDSDSVKPAMDATAKMLFDKFDEFGSIPYSQNSEHRYVDTIGLVCPFLMKYSLVYNDEKAMDIAVALIKEYSEYGLHKDFNVPVHCYDDTSKAPLGLYSWGRGCGWWAVGLEESFKILNETDENCFVEEKLIILKNMLSFADAIIKYQSNNGAFDRNIFAVSGADSSATAMISLFLAYIGKLSRRQEYISAAHKAMTYIYSVTRRSGVVDYSQGDTMGIGFYSQESIVLPATQGFALRTYMLLNK